MSSSGLLLVLACCTGLCWAQQPAWKWPCDPVTAQEDVDIDKVLGVWYIVKKIPDTYVMRCGVIGLERGNSSVSLNTFSSEVISNGSRMSDNGSLAMLSPSRWYNEATDVPAVVVDSPEDGSTLVYSACELSDWVRQRTTYILRKSPGVDVGPVEERLKAAGFVGVDDVAAEDTTDCPEGFV